MAGATRGLRFCKGKSGNPSRSGARRPGGLGAHLATVPDCGFVIDLCVLCATRKSNAKGKGARYQGKGSPGQLRGKILLKG